MMRETKRASKVVRHGTPDIWVDHCAIIDKGGAELCGATTFQDIAFSGNAGKKATNFVCGFGGGKE